MRKLLVFTSLSLLLAFHVQGQPCFPDGISFGTQQDIDNFPINNPNCTVIDGNVEIQGWEIENLNGLSAITSIGGDLVLYNNYELTSLNGLDKLINIGGKLVISGHTSLPNLNGLNKLTAIGGSLFLYGNDNLTALSGLENLTSVGGFVELQGNRDLKSLHGLQNLSSVGSHVKVFLNYSLPSLAGLNKLSNIPGNLQIIENENLASLTGLENLAHVGGYLEISQNPLGSLEPLSSLQSVDGKFTLALLPLTSLHGLEQLASIKQGLSLYFVGPLKNLQGLSNLSYLGGTLGLADMPGLKNLVGLEKLDTIHGILQLKNNYALTSLTGLEKISVVTQQVWIRDNPVLTSLNGLDGLTVVGGEIVISGNPNLSDCTIEPFCTYFSHKPDLIIENNAPGCNSEFEVFDRCPALSATVRVLHDVNGDCLPDSTDTPAAGVQVRLSGANQLLIRETDGSGAMNLDVFNDLYFALDLPQFPTQNWAVCQDSMLFDLSNFVDSVPVTFLLQPLTQCPDLSVEIGLPATFGDCSVASAVFVSTRNTGTVVAQGAKAAVLMPAGLQLVSAVPQPSGQTGDTLFFNLGDLPPFAAATVQMQVKTACSGLESGQALCLEAFAAPENPCTVAQPFSDIKLSAQCAGDSLRFTLKNIGNAPTQGPHEYVIIRNQQRGTPVPFSLDAQESLLVSVPADSATYRMEATKLDDGTKTAISKEGCGGLTPGWVTAIWQDQGPAAYDFECRQLAGALVSNRKTAIPSGAGPELLLPPNRPLEYTISFQNTSSDTATRVRLRDVLPADLDINTFQPVAASHPFTWQIRAANVLEVNFDAINLPGAGANPDASRGFFSFSIAQKPDLPDGYNLYNEASILFDYNLPLQTNTVAHTIGELKGQGYSCLPGGYAFPTQADVDDFQILYPGCAIIDGTVTIGSQFGTDITNLNGLKQLKATSGNLWITGLETQNLSGLDSLFAVGGSLEISYAGLKSLHGLEQLHSIRGMYLRTNYDLVNLSGLDNLLHCDGTISIIDNPSLKTLSGLGNLATVTGHFDVLNNDKLLHLGGLNSLTTVDGYLSIHQNGALGNLTGLENLTTAGKLSLWGNASLSDISALTQLDSAGALTIQFNPQLNSLTGLGNLRVVGENVFIQSNPMLIDLTGLDQLSRVGQDLSIQENFMLTDLSGLENITSVGGTLKITQNPELVSLGALKNLNDLGGLYLEENNALPNVNGLENSPDKLSTLWINNNSALTDLSSLSQVKAVDGDFVISGNASLASLNGLENLSAVGGSFQIGFNAVLASLAGLGPVNSVGGNVSFAFNPLLGSLAELNKLKSVGGDFFLVLNPQLTSLDGLGQLGSIGGKLHIDGNENLLSLDALESLGTLGGDLQITGNAQLSDCSIFAICNQLIYGNVSTYIMDNAPGCNSEAEIKAGCQNKPVQAVVRIDNDGNCLPDASDTPVAAIQVKLSGSAQMTTRPTDSSGVSNFSYLQTGSFSLELPQFPNQHWAVCQEPLVVSPGGMPDTVLATLLLTPLNNCPELRVSLGLPGHFRGCLVNSDIAVFTQNTGTIDAENVRVAVVLPPELDLKSAIPPVAAQNGDSLFFDMGNLAPFHTAVVRMKVGTSCDAFLLNQTLCVEAAASLNNACTTTLPPFSEIKLATECTGDSVRFILKNIGDAPTQNQHQYLIYQNETPVKTANFSLPAGESLTLSLPTDGATYRMEATKFDDGSLTATAIENCGAMTPGLINAFWQDKGSLNVDFGCRQVIGSFDPNQKTAIPTGAGPDHLLDANRPLDYTIDFQNTGTDTAFRVLLRDVLPPTLDINSFRPGYASHTCTWEIRGNTLEVLFFPIALPHTGINEPASHGFFSFSIDQLPDLPPGTPLENTASIIFDFNPPIVTNTVVHRIGHLTVRVDAPQPFDRLWQLAGNPTSDAATFRALEYIGGEKRFELFNANGRLVQAARFSGQSFQFRREGLPEGWYVFRIGDAQGRVFTGKIIVVE
ncbi:MAG: DUF11 domain-containing protein [Lewinellaceae bacterium]|nr:DUF11 domain-containing protein [Lewinellaceae bacterium]